MDLDDPKWSQLAPDGSRRPKCDSVFEFCGGLLFVGRVGGSVPCLVEVVDFWFRIHLLRPTVLGVGARRVSVW